MANKSTTSGLQAADAAVLNGAGTLKGLILVTDGTNAASLILYDNASAASGTVLAKVNAVAASGSQAIWFEAGVVCNNGIYADVTGTGAGYIVYYERG